MDPTVLSKKYMNSYHDIINRYEFSGIKDVVNLLNQAIAESDSKKINNFYSEIMDWNLHLANTEGMRLSIKTKYSSLYLPSVDMFMIIFDQAERIWKFNV